MREPSYNAEGGPRASVVFAVQAWLSEGKDGSNKSQPGILSVGMSRK